MTDGGAAFWNDQADSFDAEPDHGLTDPRVLAAWRRVLLPVLPEPPAMVADLGCGTGSLSIMAAQAGYAVCGIDFAPKMVERGRAKAGAAGVRVGFAVGDAADPPLRRRAFDAVMVRHLLWAMPDPLGAVGRWADLLGPDGVLLLVEGRWWTGGGLTAEHTAAIVRRLGWRAEVTPLQEPDLWGGPISDERYLVVSR
jgi:SAM-dependent methyltransferase